MRGRSTLLVAALVIGALALVEVLTNGDEPGDRAAGRPAPELPTSVLVPPRATLASLRGKPAVVNFWASWCGPCQKEAGELKAFQRTLHGRAALVGVDWNDSESGARSFIEEHGWTFPNLRDGDGTVGNDYDLSGLPNTFVLDRDGRIARVLRGPQTAATLRHALRAVE